MPVTIQTMIIRAACSCGAERAGRVTLVDGILAVTVLAGPALNAGAGLWWADPLAGLVIVSCAQREPRALPFQAADA
jgi:hypothetical protein